MVEGYFAGEAFSVGTVADLQFLSTLAMYKL